MALITNSLYAQQWFVKPGGGAQVDYTVRYLNGPIPDAVGFNLALRYQMADMNRPYAWERQIPRIGHYEVQLTVPFLMKTSTQRTLGEIRFNLVVSRHSNWFSRMFYKAPADEYYIRCTDFRFLVPDTLDNRPRGRSLASLPLEEQYYVVQNLKPLIEPIILQVESRLNRRLGQAYRDELPYRTE